jgi:hypothetical protein
VTFKAGQRLQASQLNANMPQLLGSTILTGNAGSITIAIPAGFNHLRGVFTARQDSGSGGAFAFVQLNGDSAANYTWETLYGNVATVTATNSGGAVGGIRVGVIPGSGDTANYFGAGDFMIGNISSSVFKPMTSNFFCPTSPTNAYSGSVGGLWLSTAAVTSVTLYPFTGNLVAGSSVSIYGWG